MIGSRAILRNGTTQRLIPKIVNTARNKGFLGLIAAGANKVRRVVSLNFWFYYYRIIYSTAIFLFQGKRYRYFIHKYNVTWRNERMIEIPILKHVLQETDGDVLEVGNVTSHYFEVNHDIVDKYERANGVATQDVTEIDTPKRYDLIISISTLEHVGWDENPDHSQLVNDPEKILKAIAKLRDLLKPNGKIVITVPLGYNPHLDNLLKSGGLKFDKQFFMKRTSRGSAWVEATWVEVKDTDFNKHVPTANAVLIGILQN